MLILKIRTENGKRTLIIKINKFEEFDKLYKIIDKYRYIIL